METVFQNVKPTSRKLYIANIKRLNGGLDVDIDNLNFLSDPHQILKYLTEKGYKLSTIRSYFISVCSLLSNLKKHKELYDKYYAILISQNKTLSVNNTKSEKQKDNWMPYDEVLILQTLVQEEALNNITEYDLILDWVILSLYTLTPPRRILDYTEMIIVTDAPVEDDLGMSNLGISNFWLVDKHQFVFTNYKTSGTYHTQIVDIPDELDFVLKTYLNQRDRTGSLLQYKDGRSITENYTITRRLNKIFGKNISVNMLRNIFLTSSFKDNKVKLSKIASEMGTSPSTIQNHYIKLDA